MFIEIVTDLDLDYTSQKEKIVQGTVIPNVAVILQQNRWVKRLLEL